MSLTTTQINKAGKILRAWMLGDNALDLEATEFWAIDVLSEFRAAHAQPLIKANNG